MNKKAMLIPPSLISNSPATIREEICSGDFHHAIVSYNGKITDKIRLT